MSYVTLAAATCQLKMVSLPDSRLSSRSTAGSSTPNVLLPATVSGRPLATQTTTTNKPKQMSGPAAAMHSSRSDYQGNTKSASAEANNNRAGPHSNQRTGPMSRLCAASYTYNDAHCTCTPLGACRRKHWHSPTCCVSPKACTVRQQSRRQQHPPQQHHEARNTRGSAKLMLALAATTSSPPSATLAQRPRPRLCYCITSKGQATITLTPTHATAALQAPQRRRQYIAQPSSHPSSSHQLVRISAT